MRAAIWAAVSSKAQAADDKVSIPLQLQLGHEHAEKNNWLVTHQLVVDGKSRSITELHIAMERVTGYQVVSDMRSDCRPYQVLRDLITSKAIDVLVYYDLDRLGRSPTLGPTIIQLCRDYRVSYYEIFSPSGIDNQDTESEMYMTAFKSIRSRVYVMKLVQARADGMVRRIKSGKFPHAIPWGWIRRYNVDGTFADVINEDVQHHFRIAFCELYMQGQPLRVIADKLNEMGSRTRTGLLWTEYTIAGPLKMIWRYAGFSEINRRSKNGSEHVLSPGNWPAIITVAEAEAIVSERQRRAASKRMVTSPYLLSGVLVCDRCGTHMNYNGAHLLRCQWNDKKGTHKDGTIAKTYVRVKHVLEILKLDFESLNNQEIRDEVIANLDIQGDTEALKRLDALDTQLKRIEANRQKASIDYYVDNAYSADIHRGIIAELDKRQKVIEKQRVDLQLQINETRSIQNIDTTLSDLAINGIAMLSHPDIRLANAWLMRRIRVMIRDNRVVEIKYQSVA